jgi:hypothetical protein
MLTVTFTMDQGDRREMATSSTTSNLAAEGNPNCAETFASLQLFGDDLVPEEIGRLLGLQATESAAKGSRTVASSGKIRVAPSGRWILETRGRVSSTGAEDHVKWLLEQLDSSGLVPGNIPGVRRSSICCYWVSATGNGGPQFSPEVLGRLSSYHLTLGLDIYFDAT